MPIFQRLEQVPSTSLFRSSAPNYACCDDPHEIAETALAELRNFGCLRPQGLLIVSLNEFRIPTANENDLTSQNIDYRHLPVADFQPPSREQFVEATQFIHNARLKSQSTLIYCGYGDGRTGTMIAGYLILTGEHVYDEAWAGSLHVERAVQHRMLASLKFRSVTQALS